MVGELEDVAPYLPATLQLLDLRENPVAKRRGLFELVCARCPRLRSFNGRALTEQ